MMKGQIQFMSLVLFIKRKSQENSSSPLNVMTTANIEAQGLNNLGDLARNMTFNAGSELNTDAFTQNFSTGTSNVNLRNLGLSSTLVLLNGKDRHYPLLMPMTVVHLLILARLCHLLWLTGLKH